MSQHQFFTQLLMWAAERESGAARDYPPKVLGVYDRLNARFPRIDERRLATLSQATELDLLSSGRFVYLEANKKGSWSIPVLTVKYDFSGEPELLRLRLALCALVADENPLQAIGLRFETPEGEGLHSYYHVQMIESFSKGVEEHRIPGAAWIPQRIPAIPVDAMSPITLLLAFLLSLYGMAHLQLLRQAGFSTAFWNAVRDVRYT